MLVNNSLKEKIIIFDTTLRDGEQAPGATMNLEEKFLRRMDTDLTKEITEINEAMDKNKILSFRQFSEDAVAPANNAMATAGVAGLDKNVPVSKKAQKTWTAANAMFKRGKPNA